MKDVFSQRVQQIQLFTFFFFFFFALFQKAIAKLQENEFCASCHGDWSAQWTEDSRGRQGAEFTSEFLITVVVALCGGLQNYTERQFRYLKENNGTSGGENTGRDFLNGEN